MAKLVGLLIEFERFPIKNSFQKILVFLQALSEALIAKLRSSLKITNFPLLL